MEWNYIWSHGGSELMAIRNFCGLCLQSVKPRHAGESIVDISLLSPAPCGYDVSPLSLSRDYFSLFNFMYHWWMWNIIFLVLQTSTMKTLRWIKIKLSKSITSHWNIFRLKADFWVDPTGGDHLFSWSINGNRSTKLHKTRSEGQVIVRGMQLLHAKRRRLVYKKSSI